MNPTLTDSATPKFRNESRFARLATAVGEIVTRHPTQLVWVVGPAACYYLMWNLFRHQLATLTAQVPVGHQTITIIVLALTALSALCAYGVSRIAVALGDPRTAESQNIALGVTLERLDDEESTALQDLQSANERLRELDALKSKFVAEVGHELRAPLAAIVSGANIILRYHATKPDAVERFGSTIVTEGKRLARLVNDLLDLTKIEAKCAEWDDVETDAEEMVHQALLGVEPVAIDAQIELESEFEDGLPDPCIDRDRILQVLTNLLNNAIKFTPRGGTVTTRVSHTDNALVFAVEDNGIGIAEDDCPYIFDRFVRAHSRGHDLDTAASEGTSAGLGLCISREIVEHYGGRIWVESEVGKGSTFSFTIPVESASTYRTGSAATVDPQVRSLCVLALLDSKELSDRVHGIDPHAAVKCRTCESVGELTDELSTYLPDAVLISASLIPESRASLFEALRNHGMTEVLVHSDDGRIRARAIRDSSVLAVRKLHYHASRGSRILLVDDDKKFLEIVEWELTHAGYVVRTASDGQEALSILESEKIAAVLLDVMLPHVDGLSVLEAMRRFSKKIPVIMLTAMTDDELVTTAKSLGAVDVIRKDGIEPSSNTLALARIQSVLSPLLAAGADE